MATRWGAVLRAQTSQSLANRDIILQTAGGSLADLVQTQVTLTDWHAYREYNAACRCHVPFPTISTFQRGLGREGSS
jgi:enamine deaminase RidA (YjgF/YER057c/UK114 family)